MFSVAVMRAGARRLAACRSGPSSIGARGIAAVVSATVAPRAFAVQPRAARPVSSVPIVRLQQLAPAGVDVILRRAPACLSPHRSLRLQTLLQALSPDTGPKIIDELHELGGRDVDFLIAAADALLQGVGSALRKRFPQMRVLVVEPDSRPHPTYEAEFGPHPSWPAELLGDWIDVFGNSRSSREIREACIDEELPVTGQEAVAAARALAEHEGIDTGTAGGALLAGALRVARSAPAGSSVLALLPPSTTHMPARTSGDEVAIFRSVTPQRQECGGELSW